MVEHHTLLELTIDLDTENDEVAFKRLLPSLPLEKVVLQTLFQAGFKQSVMLSLLITNDETLHHLNRQYRGQDKTTDVLSFPLHDTPIVDAPSEQLWGGVNVLQRKEIPIKKAFITPPELTMHLGDIVISWPTVIRQSSEAGHTATYELLFLLSHGVLHLIGYDDQSEVGYQAMIHLQQAVMENLGQKA